MVGSGEPLPPPQPPRLEPGKMNRLRQSKNSERRTVTIDMVILSRRLSNTGIGNPLCKKDASETHFCDREHVFMKRLVIDYEKLTGASYSRQNQLAKKLGITQPTVSRWVKGTIRLSLDDLNRLAAALGRHTTDFVVEIDDEDSEN